MIFTTTLLIDFSVILILIAGIWLFRKPHTARFGNMMAALALVCAFVLVLYRNGIVDAGTVIIALLAGSVIGYAVAKAVDMLQIPAMVAFQHGAGGVAAFLISYVELTRGGHALDLIGELSGVLGLAIGSFTFSGSMIASAKLANKMKQTPQILPAHSIMLLLVSGVLLIVGLTSFQAAAGAAAYLYIALIVLSAAIGVLFSIRIGGADMPVLISFLNATAGLAAAFCGMVIGNQLLIAFGATVAASGSILTHVMCKAMNRSIAKIFLPHATWAQAPGKHPDAAGLRHQTTAKVTNETGAVSTVDQFQNAIEVIENANKIVIIPGYGMALAKAQQSVAELATEMMKQGKDVKFAIHPVAGRMPGHMNVLLAEAGIDYDMLVDMEDINPEFPATDLALVIGACDVVNPAAIDTQGSPISGMPILMAHKAKDVICCNFDHKPGYSGVENPLYAKRNTIMLTGDAKLSVHQLLVTLKNGKPQTPAVAHTGSDPIIDAATALSDAKKIIIVPGYGMALAKAQFEVVELASILVKNGADVKYAIHPVAGRMPGHMNVILAEAEVDYDDLLFELDEANPLFEETDVALVIGACDVVNPAAMQKDGTPISGMPILTAHKAGKIIICNFDEKPGYSGVPNPLYNSAGTIKICEDAKLSIRRLISVLSSK